MRRRWVMVVGGVAAYVLHGDKASAVVFWDGLPAPMPLGNRFASAVTVDLASGERQVDRALAGRHLPLRSGGDIVRPLRGIASGGAELRPDESPMLFDRRARQLVRHVLARQARRASR